MIVGCSEIFKTEIDPIKDCSQENVDCSYTESIQPIFDAYCTRCHGNGGGLDLTSYTALFKGGNSGESIIPYISLF